MIIDLILFVIKVYQFFDLMKLKYIGKNEKTNYWLDYCCICINMGHIKMDRCIEPNFVINFFAIGGFCFGVYLTKDPNEENDDEFKSNN